LLDFDLAGKVAVMLPTTEVTVVDTVVVTLFGPDGVAIFTFFSFEAPAAFKVASSADFRFFGMLICECRPRMNPTDKCSQSIDNQD
jgi:ABC-type uncharacterized transport system YnjBCD ATPase subunit